MDIAFPTHVVPLISFLTLWEIVNSYERVFCSCSTQVYTDFKPIAMHGLIKMEAEMQESMKVIKEQHDSTSKEDDDGYYALVR